MEGAVDGASFHSLVAGDGLEMSLGLTGALIEELEHLAVPLSGSLLSGAAVQMALLLLVSDFDAVHGLLVELVLHLDSPVDLARLVLHVGDGHIHALETLLQETRNVLVVQPHRHLPFLRENVVVLVDALVLGRHPEILDRVVQGRVGGGHHSAAGILQIVLGRAAVPEAVVDRALHLGQVDGVHVAHLLVLAEVPHEVAHDGSLVRNIFNLLVAQLREMDLRIPLLFSFILVAKNSPRDTRNFRHTRQPNTNFLEVHRRLVYAMFPIIGMWSNLEALVWIR